MTPRRWLHSSQNCAYTFLTDMFHHCEWHGAEAALEPRMDAADDGLILSDGKSLDALDRWHNRAQGGGQD